MTLDEIAAFELLANLPRRAEWIADERGIVDEAASEHATAPSRWLRADMIAAARSLSPAAVMAFEAEVEQRDMQPYTDREIAILWTVMSRETAAEMASTRERAVELQASIRSGALTKAAAE